MKSKKFRQLELKAKSIINSYNSGFHLSNLLDNFEEIHSIKQFQPGDKKLDVRASIKYHELMAKTFNPEKQLDIYILLDVSGSQECSNKADLSLLLSLYLLFLAEITDDRVCLITFNNKAISSVLTNDYSDLQQRLSSVEFSGISDFDKAVNQLICHYPHNSLIFIISDFLFDVDRKIENKLKSLSASNNHLFALTLKEKNVIRCGCLVLDSESNNYVNIDFSNVNYASHQSKVISSLRKFGCVPISIDISSDNPLLPLIKKLL